MIIIIIIIIYSFNEYIDLYAVWRIRSRVYMMYNKRNTIYRKRRANTAAADVPHVHYIVNYNKKISYCYGRYYAH